VGQASGKRAANKQRAQQRDELLGHLREQFEWLVSSCRGYDAFTFSEAKRIATIVRTLVHHTNRSHALLVQLDVRRLMHFHDCCGPVDAPGLVHRMGALAMISTNPVWGDYVPQFETVTLGPTTAPPPVLFELWWREPLWRDKRNVNFNREALVLALANKDGGAHVDPTLPEDYDALSRGNSLGITRAPTIDGPGVDLTTPVPAAVRQVGHELVRSCQWWLPRALARVGVEDDDIKRVIAPLDSYSTPPRDPGHGHAIEQPPEWVTT
jgi:hypothetical protein